MLSSRSQTAVVLFHAHELTASATSGPRRLLWPVLGPLRRWHASRTPAAPPASGGLLARGGTGGAALCRASGALAMQAASSLSCCPRAPRSAGPRAAYRCRSASRFRRAAGGMTVKSSATPVRSPRPQARPQSLAQAAHSCPDGQGCAAPCRASGGQPSSRVPPSGMPAAVCGAPWQDALRSCRPRLLTQACIGCAAPPCCQLLR